MSLPYRPANFQSVAITGGAGAIGGRVLTSAALSPVQGKLMLSPVLLLFGLAGAPAATAPVAAAHGSSIDTRLNYLVGDWVIRGFSSTVFHQKCSWFSGRAFVLCTFQDGRDSTVGQTIFGYSEARKRFTYYRYDSRGRGLYQLGFPYGTYGIVFTDERQEPEGIVRVQTTFNLEDEGLRYTQYRSVEGRNWERTADFQYVPAAQQPPLKKRRR